MNGRGRRIVLIIGLVIVVGAVLFGYRYYYNAQHFVATDNAQIAGELVQVSPSNGGRVVSLAVDVGDAVKRGQSLGTVNVPMASTLGLGAAPGPTQGTQISSALVSPVDGVIVAKSATPGDLVSPGQPVLTLVDLGKLWVTANIDEGQISRIKIGQAVDIHIDTLNKNLTGQVMAITPASAATFSLLPQNNASGNFTKVTQRVPVKITMNYAGSLLFPGTSVEVNIKVA
ncbi:MAG: HlyD family secretion protein [Chloroflexota bacterium]|nr:HlyD family secretion protein [Chloroflexota bacterium]